MPGKDVRKAGRSSHLHFQERWKGFLLQASYTAPQTVPWLNMFCNLLVKRGSPIKGLSQEKKHPSMRKKIAVFE